MYLLWGQSSNQLRNHCDQFTCDFNCSFGYFDFEALTAIKKKFTNLKLYKTKTYFERYNGWLAVDDENDEIFVHT